VKTDVPSPDVSSVTPASKPHAMLAIHERLLLRITK
jgi:hypothetical protein